ncbi:MAG: hydroxymethylglutaryl-CoA synthase [Dehalococcoidia bacterium]|nr:hydroxymethylglutaryl-CoA synthase [Dehalococcoidia bacterium]
MAGITSYGAYIPLYRLNRMTIYTALGWLNPASLLPGERSVANYDEDSITMAVSAAMDCLKGMDRSKVGGLFFATTTSPYKERDNAAIIATALDLPDNVRSGDFTTSIKAGTTALISAFDAVKSGTASSVMVTSADSRLGRPGGFWEEIYGDGAAALLLGNEGVIAEFKGSYSLSYDFVDSWRTADDAFNRTWEDRWVRDEGYGKFISEAVTGLMKKYNLSPGDFAKVVYPCTYIRAHADVGKKLGFQPAQIQDHMFTQIGNTGTPYTLMILVAALENAKPGDRILVASYGNGSDAFYLEVTGEIEKVKGKRGIKGHLAAKKDLGSYEKYVTFRDVLPIDTGGRGDEIAPTQLSTLWRSRKDVLGLCGSKCQVCGTPHFPSQQVCVKPTCGATRQMDHYRFSDRPGRLFTYTGDVLAFSPSPPAIYGLVDFEGGGRWMFDLTDCELEALQVGMPVEMSMRRKYYDAARGIHGYFWKATPGRA